MLSWFGETGSRLAALFFLDGLLDSFSFPFLASFSKGCSPIGAIQGKVFPVIHINVEGLQGLFERVFVTSLWGPNISLPIR